MSESAEPRARHSALPALRDIAAALGGPAAFGWAQWLVTLVPAITLVLIFEKSFGLSEPLFLAGTAVAQHSVAALVVPLAVTIRHRDTRLPAWCGFALWGLVGAGRGLVGALLAATVDADPHLDHRVLYWVAVAWIWMPLTAYCIEQLDVRRHLRAQRAVAEAREQRASSRRADGVKSMDAQLKASVRDSITPVVHEIEQLLKSSRWQDSAAMAAVGERLSRLSREVTALISVSPPVVDTPPIGKAPLEPLHLALDFERRRPVLWASATGAGLAAVLLPPYVNRLFHGDLLHPLLALLVAVAVLAASSSLLPARRRVLRARVRGAIARYAGVGSAASLLLGALAWPDVDEFTVLVMTLLPLGTLYAAGVVSTAVGVREANRDLEQSIAATDERRRIHEEILAADEADVRRRLRQLLHGPVQGRLAACAMALNFDAAAPQRDDEARRRLVRAVLAHLDAVSADLTRLR